jgi:copper transport protein
MSALGSAHVPAPARRTSRLRRLVLVLAAVGALALAGPVPAAQAHAFLASSTPADGQVLTTAPDVLRLDFSESVVLSATRIDLVDGAGRHLAPTALDVVSAEGAAGTESPVQVVATLPALDRGTYRVSWETLSSDDLHATSGVLVFGVDEAVVAGGLVEPTPPPTEAGLRWLVLLGLSGALGGALAARLYHRTGGQGAGLDALLARRISLWGAVLGAVVAVLLLGYQVTAGGVGVTRLLWSSYGLRWGVREAGLLLLVASPLVGLRTVRVRTVQGLLAAGAVLACVGSALLGHSGAAAGSDVTRVVASATHLAAAATWAGGVAVLAVTLIRRARGGTATGPVAREVLRRFGPPAAVYLGVMVVTGVYLSSDVVGSVDAAISTIYGRTLLLKVALAGVAGALALVNTLRLRRRSHRPAPRRTVVAEAVVALGVLALAAVLTSGQPAMEPQLVRAAPVASGTLVDRPVADLQETVAVRPNQPGANVMLIDVFNTRRPAPAPIRAVEVSVTAADGAAGPALAAEPLANGRWSVNTDLTAPGAVSLRIVVHRAGMPDAIASYPWTVGGLPDQTRPTVISTAPIRSVLRLAALTILLLLVLGWWLTRSIRRRRGPRALSFPWGSGRAGAAPEIDPVAWLNDHGVVQHDADPHDVDQDDLVQHDDAVPAVHEHEHAAR